MAISADDEGVEGGGRSRAENLALDRLIGENRL